MLRRFALVSLIALPLVVRAQEPEPNMADALQKAMGAIMSGGTNKAAVVDFRDIKAQLPTELTGLKRVNASGERSGAMGMTISYAVADYRSDDGAYLTIKISDMSGTGSMGALMQGWALSEVDRETETGYERTTTIAGQKALEKYDTAAKGGEIQVMVDKRFMIEISASNVSDETLHEAVNKIDMAKLAALQPKPQPQP